MTLGPKPPPDGGTGPNLIRPQTCSLAFRCAPKQPQNSGRICLANRLQGNVAALLIHHQNREILLINAYGKFPVSVLRLGKGGSMRYIEF